MPEGNEEQRIAAIIFGRTIIGTARAAGVAVSTLVERLGIEPDDLEDPELWLPARKVEEFLALVGDKKGLSAPGLWVGEQICAEAADLVGYAMRTATNLGEAYRTAARYYGLVGTGVEVYYRESDDYGHLIHAVTPDRVQGRRHRDELIVASVVTLGRHITGQRWMPHHISFQHGRPDDASAHVALFGENVRFREPATEIVIDRATASLESHMADGALHDILERYAQTLLREQSGMVPLLRKLRETILHTLPAGDITVDGVASALNMSSRTLQRRLREHGTTYGDVLRQTRQYMAEGLLGESTTSVDEIAFMLGYSNTPAFSRAFKEWTDVSPTALRRHGRGDNG